MIYSGILEVSLTLCLYSSLPQVTDARWGGGNGGWGGQYGLGGFHTGYGHQGYGYGSGICAGARQRQGGGTTFSQPSTNYAYNNNNNNNNNPFSGYNNGYYPDPLQTPQRTMQTSGLSNMGSVPNHYSNLDYRINSFPTPAPTTCSHPNVRDVSIFEQQCIFPRESTKRSCASQGSSLPTGTTAIMVCKSPQYYSDAEDAILEICKDGKWYSDGKTLTCKFKMVVPQLPATPPRYSSPDQVVQYVQTPQAVDQPRMSAASDLGSKSVQDSNRQPNIQPHWTYTQPALSTPTLPQSNIQTSEPMQVATADPQGPPESQSRYWNYYNQTRTPSENNLNHYPPYSPPIKSTESEPTTTQNQKPYYIDKIDWRVNSNRTPYENYYDSSQCQPLPSKPGVILECLTKSVNNTSGSSGYTLSISDCQEPQVIGTEATYKCKTYYEPLSGIETQYRKCKENGIWTGSDDGFGCKLECGKSNSGGRLPLITFGETTILGQWPWHASLFIRDRDDFRNACGGTLISQKAVLTAAHCVTLQHSSVSRNLNDIRIDLGRYYREKNDPYVQKFQVEKIVTHPAYNPYIYESDIAIIILKEKAKIGFHVRPICFPKAQNAAFDSMQLEDGSYLTVVGFGVDETGKSPDELKLAKIQVIGYRECIESFEEDVTGSILAKSTTFCAGNKNGTNVCRGDSGSGAFFAVKTSSGSTHWYIQGLVSVGTNTSPNDKKCDPRISIFTRVSPYSDWIIRVLSENDAI